MCYAVASSGENPACFVGMRGEWSKDNGMHGYEHTRTSLLVFHPRPSPALAIVVHPQPELLLFS